MPDQYRRALGAAINRLPDKLKAATIEAALWHLERTAYRRLRDSGFRPESIVDVGAHVGDWTRTIKQIFPDAHVVMIDARDEVAADLDRVVKELSNVHYQIALLGAEAREGVPFHVQGSGSSIYPECSDAPRRVVMATMRTLDSIVADLRTPILMKLDVQGAEFDVLRGAPKTLAKTEILQVEIPLLQYNDGAPSFVDQINSMHDIGFVVYDIAGFIRPTGKDLVQLDVLFARADSALRPRYFTFQSKQPGELPDKLRKR